MGVVKGFEKAGMTNFSRSRRCRFSSFRVSFPRKRESILSFLHLAERKTNNWIPAQEYLRRISRAGMTNFSRSRRCSFSSFRVSFPRKRESILSFLHLAERKTNNWIPAQEYLRRISRAEMTNFSHGNYYERSKIQDSNLSKSDLIRTLPCRVGTRSPKRGRDWRKQLRSAACFRLLSY